MSRIEFRYKSAYAVIVPWMDGYLLMNVRTEIPRQGHGSGVLRLVTEYADSHQIVLFLEVCAGRLRLQELALDDRELESWYGRHGFETWPEQVRHRPRRMYRNPKETHG